MNFLREKTCADAERAFVQRVVLLLQDIQSLPLPLFLHEPTTEMMKAAEDMEHSSLLDEACLLAVPLPRPLCSASAGCYIPTITQAALLPVGSIERLLRVAAFALAPYATGGAPQRARKPFDGMLGGELSPCLWTSPYYM